MADGGIKQVQVSALAVMKIIKHSSQIYPTIATGTIVGMEVSGTLEVTNCFSFPLIDVPVSDGAQQDPQANMAAAMPRAKQNTAYQLEMIKMLREVNVDANNVGWYTSTNMGNFVNMNTIENQCFYQKELGERTVALVHDVGRSGPASLTLRAFRLSPTFMTAYKEGKFTVERCDCKALNGIKWLTSIAYKNPIYDIRTY
jgi:translation initiation factor 3 subunit H